MSISKDSISIGSDVARAWTLPSHLYTEPDAYDAEVEKIFRRSWQVVGHHDQVAPDEWVASEYARTRYFYDQFGLGDRTAIEFFNGGHTINGQGTFAFLHQHLNWPEPAPK